MFMARRLALIAALMALAFVLWLGSVIGIPRQTAYAAETPPVPPEPTHQWIGTAGCASMGCHNANGLRGDPGSEYTTWLVHDPHARAYEILFSDKSRTIVKKLQLEDKRPAHELPLCLNCHVHKGYAEANHSSRFTKEDGVGCESCHGPAGAWASEHYKPQWANLTPTAKTDKGMWDTQTLVGRVKSCTPCHVGAAGMDVNHDLIAAEHPRLAFEFSAYHALMPHHWQDKKDKEAGYSPRARPDWDAAAWFVGQALTSEAAVQLLASRTEKVWPEFAEYDCTACHHSLQDESWRQRQNREFAGRRPGNLPWNEWYLSPLPYQGGIPQQLAKLKRLMEDKIVPDKDAVRVQAGLASAELAMWAKRFDQDRQASDKLAAMLRELVNKGSKESATSWDEAAQRYLAVVAAYHAKSTQPLPLESLKDIRFLLQSSIYRDGAASGFTPERLQNSYLSLLNRLGS